MMFDFAVPKREPSNPAEGVKRLDAIFIFFKATGLGLYEAKTIIDRNFEGTGAVPARELGLMIAAWYQRG